MADLLVKTESQNSQTPLLNSSQQNNHRHQQQEGGPGENEDLSQTLERLEKFLTFLGFKQSSLLSIVLSWTAFLVFGVLVPVLVLELSHCSGCERYQIKDFELEIVATQACLAAVSLLCLSHNLRKYGIRRFLFVDRHSGHMVRFRKDYIKQISVRLLFILVVCNCDDILSCVFVSLVICIMWDEPKGQIYGFEFCNFV